MKTTAAYYNFAFDTLPETFNASILECRPHKKGLALVLDATIFYPEGGGQPGDRGTINGRRVIDVLEEEGEILHIVAADAGTAILENCPAVLAVDRRRRRDFTVQHSAQHLLSGTILRMTGFPTVSMHLGEAHNDSFPGLAYNTIDIDVNGSSLDTAVLGEIEEAAALAIEEDHCYITHLCPPERVEDFPLRKVPPRGEDVIRVVEIEGCDFSPCCGTHIASTGEIGILRIIGTEKYKGMIRLTFTAGRRCLADSRMLRANGELISRTLKVPVEETGRAAAALMERAASLEQKLKLLEEASARREAEALANAIAEQVKAEAAAGGSKETVTSGGVRYTASNTEKSFEEILRIGKLVQGFTDVCFVLGSKSALKFAAFCSAKDADIRPCLKSALDRAGGSGGGGPSFFQGQFDSAEKYNAFFGSFKPWV